MRYVFSREGQEAVIRDGYLPLPPGSSRPSWPSWSRDGRAPVDADDRPAPAQGRAGPLDRDGRRAGHLAGQWGTGGIGIGRVLPAAKKGRKAAVLSGIIRTMPVPGWGGAAKGNGRMRRELGDDGCGHGATGCRCWCRGGAAGRALGGLLTAAGDRPALAVTPGDVLVIGICRRRGQFGPHVTMTNRSWAVTYYAYERLVRYKVKTAWASPRWSRTWPPAGRSATTARCGRSRCATDARFADGTPVDAHAVVYSFNRLLAIGEGPADAFPTLAPSRRVDDYTVRFTLSEPFAPFLLTLANNGAGHHQPAPGRVRPGRLPGRAYLAEHTMGSGPFQLQRWDKDQQIVLGAQPPLRWPSSRPFAWWCS